MLGDFTGIEVSKLTKQRYAEEAGAAYEQMQTEEVEYLERQMRPACGRAEKMQLSADGAMVPLLHGVWAEVRTLVVGEVQPAARAAMQLQAGGREIAPGQSVQFLFTRGGSGVQAWELGEALNPGRVDAKRYCALLDRAIRTVLDPCKAQCVPERLL